MNDELDIYSDGIYATVAPPFFEEPTATVNLREEIHVAVTAAGQITSITLGDSRMFGEPFDRAAAERAMEWARAELAKGASA